MKRVLACSALLAVAGVVAATILAAAGPDATDRPAGPREEPLAAQRPQPDRAGADRQSRSQHVAHLPRIDWRDSTALGVPEAGSLVRGVRLPREGRSYFTWDPIRRERPNRTWRRWGTDVLIRTVLRVVRGYARDHPGAPRVGIGDLSLPEGGDFGPDVGGGIGHGTHQNGLDVDVYYPLRSGAERAPRSVDEIDLALAQDLVDRFVAAGATVIYVGPSTPLTGPTDVVVPLVHHDDHLHVRVSG